MPKHSAIDYSLKRRALLADVYAGRIGASEVCDAHPYLQRAARFHGDKTNNRCPMCRRDNLTLVHYVYGDEMKIGAGQAKSSRQIESMANLLPEFNVYVVEVCPSCDWNHLIESFTTGLPPTDVAKRPRRAGTPPRRRSAESHQATQ